MAVITPSALISEIRGSVGAQTFSRNRYGAYVKAKLIQTNPNTVPQQDVRAAMATALTEWQALSQANQNKWIDYAATNIIGKNISRKIRRAGYNEYVSRAMNRFAVSGAGTDFQPLPKVRLFPIITSVTTAATNITINFDTQKAIGTCDLIIYATPPISAGINEINPSLYRIIGVVTPAAQVSSTNIYTLYNTMFPLGPGDIGKKIGVAIKAVNTDNFAPGQFFFARTIISGGLVSASPQVLAAVTKVTLSTTSWAITFPFAPAANELIVLITRTVTSSTDTPPAGFTLLKSQATGSISIRTYYKIADGTESATFTITGTVLGGRELSGFIIDNIDLTTPIVEINSVNSTAGVNNVINASYNAPANSLYIVGTAWQTFGTIGYYSQNFIKIQESAVLNLLWCAHKVYNASESGLSLTFQPPCSSFVTQASTLMRVNAP